MYMEDVRQSLQQYLEAWQDWHPHADGFAFGDLPPMHAGWKVPDELSLGQKITIWLPYTEQGHIGSVNNRKIALLALKEAVEGVPVLQIMQLRPGSRDPLGLDHVAFYCPDIVPLQNMLEQSAYRWEHQSNPGHSWISLWFGEQQLEAKFFDHTSLDLGARELSEASAQIKTR